MKLNTTKELISEIKKGNMIVLMDDEDRENEGDLILSADKVNAEKINFMAKHARGLICMAITEEKSKSLNLDMMVKENKSGHGTAFTVSIEAAKGISTGISAADRAKTISVAAKHNAKPDDIVQPGHVFPVQAVRGGVLTRAGHTEGSTDLCRLANLSPNSVIVEIMNEDGTMARKADLIRFSKKHNLKIGTIADLINYRILNEKTVEKVHQKSVKTAYGNFTLIVYKDSIFNETHIALKKGKITKSKPTLVRVQQTNYFHDLLRVDEYGARWSVNDAMQKIQKEGSGVILLIDSNNSKVEEFKGMNRKNSGKEFTAQNDPRRIGVGSQILRDLGVKEIQLMGSQTRYPSISGFGLEVVKYVKK